MGPRVDYNVRRRRISLSEVSKPMHDSSGAFATICLGVSILASSAITHKVLNGFGGPRKENDKGTLT